jgi:hypothetical protein
MTVKEFAKHAGLGQGLAHLLIAEGQAPHHRSGRCCPASGRAEQCREKNER